jgi:hypothetical protein
MGDAFEVRQVVGVTEFRTVHRDYQKGIYVPAGEDTALSIRFRPEENDDWGYSDHWLDVGRSLDYTGQGAPPAHQTWNRWNQGLRNAHESKAPVHVFEVLPRSPRAFRYWGQMLVTRWYEKSVLQQGRNQLRFVLERSV